MSAQERLQNYFSESVHASGILTGWGLSQTAELEGGPFTGTPSPFMSVVLKLNALSKAATLSSNLAICFPEDTLSGQEDTDSP